MSGILVVIERRAGQPANRSIARISWEALSAAQRLGAPESVTAVVLGAETESTAAEIAARAPGKVLRVLVKPGDQVKARQGLVVVEAMKMENELRSPKDGRVVSVPAIEGMSVEAGRLLVVVE